MSKVWSWVFAIAIAVVILGFLAYGKSSRQDYWSARRATSPQVVLIQVPSDQVLEWRLHHWFKR